MILSPNWRAENNKDYIGSQLGTQSNQVAHALGNIGTALAGIEAIGVVLEANANGFYDESDQANRLRPITEAGLAEAVKALSHFALVELDGLNNLMLQAKGEGA